MVDIKSVRRTGVGGQRVCTVQGAGRRAGLQCVRLVDAVQVRGGG